MNKEQQTIVNITSLEKYTWWQLKKHSKAKKPVHTCTIQDLKDKAIYYSATENIPQEAIDKAVADAAEARS